MTYVALPPNMMSQAQAQAVPSGASSSPEAFASGC
jgi:hypothetical protein